MFMFAQFRAQYPMGSLISELLQIHEGKYIVRASIQVGGSTLATGLSAAHTIEQAEDQARSRALVVLGIEERPYPTQVHFINPNPQESVPPIHSPRLSAAPAEFLPVNEAAFQRALDMEWNPNEQPDLSFHAPEQQQMSWLNPNPEPPLQNRSYPANRSGSQPFPDRQYAQEPISKEPSQKNLTQPSASPSGPVDLSDIIAQTDVELKRLGWTQAQGRRYLEKVYEKRSRQHLTDAELIEFLDYLKAQPNPVK
jgi:hypothetical protein